MDTKLKKGTILDATQQIVARPPDNTGDLNLPPGVQALIEARITQARTELRDNIQVDFHRFAEERVKAWKKATAILGIFAAVVVVVFTFWTWLVTPEMVKKTAETWAATNLVEGPLRERVDRVLAEKGEAWAADKFAPLSERTTVLSDKVGQLSSEISKQQEILRTDQEKLRDRTEALTTQVTGLSSEIRGQQEALRADQQRIHEQVAIQDLAVAARVGDSEAWNRLCEMASGNTQFAKNAKAAKEDVEQSYNTDRYKLTGTFVRIDTASQKQIQQTLEEAIGLLHNSVANTRNAAANELNELKLKSAVTALCTAIHTETDLRVVARMTRALETITGVKFDPLDRAKVSAWWEQNRERAEYSFPMADHELGRRFFVQGPSAEFGLYLNPTTAQAAIPHLETVVAVEPKATLTRYYLSLARMAVGDLEGAQRELDEMEKSDGRQYWRTPILRAILAVQHKEHDKAVDALNAAFDVSPSSAESYARSLAVFRDYRDDPKVKWPKSETSGEQGGEKGQ